MDIDVLMVVVVEQLPGLVLVLVRSLLVGDLMQEALGFLSPPALLHRAAHQAGRREVQDASGGQIGELGHADGQVFVTVSTLLLSINEEITGDQLVDGTCQITLCTQEANDAHAKQMDQ